MTVPLTVEGSMVKTNFKLNWNDFLLKKIFQLILNFYSRWNIGKEMLLKLVGEFPVNGLIIFFFKESLPLIQIIAQDQKAFDFILIVSCDLDSYGIIFDVYV